jgi:hypothetical protein
MGSTRTKAHRRGGSDSELVPVAVVRRAVKKLLGSFCGAM